MAYKYIELFNKVFFNFFNVIKFSPLKTSFFWLSKEIFRVAHFTKLMASLLKNILITMESEAYREL